MFDSENHCALTDMYTGLIQHIDRRLSKSENILL